MQQAVSSSGAFLALGMRKAQLAWARRWVPLVVASGQEVSLSEDLRVPAFGTISDSGSDIANHASSLRYNPAEVTPEVGPHESIKAWVGTMD